MRGYDWLWMILVLAISGLLAWIGFWKLAGTSPRTRDAVNQRSIVMSLRDYAAENEGQFPAHDDDGVAFTNSTAAFHHLLKNSDGLKEEYFNISSHPEKGSRGANGDGELLPVENCLAYVTGMNTAMPPDSPITADEMDSPGVYGAKHPWLQDGFAIVGYLDGTVQGERLTRKAPGATVKGPRQTKIKNIFQPRPAGLLSVPRENILQP